MECPNCHYQFMLPKDKPLFIQSKGTVTPCPSPITIPTICTPSITLAPKADELVFHFTDIKGNHVKDK